MINVIDASSLYLSSRAMTKSMVSEFTEKWFEPMTRILAQVAIDQVRANPVLDRELLQDEQASALYSEIGG